MTTVLGEDTLSKRNLTANVRRNHMKMKKVLYSLVAGAEDLSLNLQATILVKQKSLGGPSQSLHKKKLKMA